MKRKNFYILLNLPVKPPEEDLKKIEAAINKKQTEWSRLLRHPSKGIPAKQLISLIPEIRKVMTDPDLRKKEAMEAQRLLKKKKQQKFAAIDRHLSIFLSKGAVTSKEIQKLVKHHSVETDEILKWMLKKERASQAPAKKTPDKKEDTVQPIIVNDDTERTRRFLKSFNSDIEIAESGGSIRTEYFEAIASNAVKSGMDYKEACNYIEAYCRVKGWKTTSRKQRNRLRLMYAAAISLVLIVSIGSVVLVSVLKTRHLSKEYEGVIEKVKSQQKLEKKKKLLTEYVKSAKESDFKKKAEQEIQVLDNKIIMRNSTDEKDYRTALTKAAVENSNQNYEESGIIYETYLKKHPDGIHAEELRIKRSEIPDLLDNRDFNAIKALSEKNYEKRIEACTAYLANHPDGMHRDEVTTLIAEMEEPYYGFLKNKIVIHEKKKDWEECIDLCEQYFKYFQRGHYFNELKGLQLFFKKQLDNRIALDDLIQKAENNVDSMDSAKAIYTDYLNANPNSPIKHDVRKRLKEISK
ncbi:MAG: hypothetical protein R6X10_17430 [Desulfobacterales bacterium]